MNLNWPTSGRHGLFNRRQSPLRVVYFCFFINYLKCNKFGRNIWLNIGFPGGSDGKESACNAGDLSLIPDSERSPGEGNGSPLQCSCLENSMDRRAWWATVDWGHKEWDTTERQHFHMFRSVTWVYVSRFLSHHNKDLEWWTLKPPRRVTALGSWTDHVIAVRSWMDHVIALRQISVTAQCYSSILFRR